MNKLNSIIIQLVLVFIICLNADAQKLIKEKIFNFNLGERIIFSDENRIKIYNGKKTYLLFIEKIENTDTFQYAIHNGTYYGPYKEIYYPEIEIFNKTGHFYFVALKKNKLYVNIDGKEFGGYDEVNPEGNCCYHLLLNEKGNFAYSFKIDDDWKLNINEKIIDVNTPGSYRFNWFDLSLYEDGTYSYVNKNNDKYEVYTNNNSYKNIDKILNQQYAGKNSFFMCYRTEGKYYLVSKNKQFGPYNEIGYSAFNTDAKFCYTFKKEDKWYASVNGKIIGPYDKINNYYGVKYDNLGNYWFGFQKDDKWYLHVNGEVKGPFSSNNTKAYFSKKYKMLRYINMEGKTCYVLNGKKLGEFQKTDGGVNDYVFLKDGNIHFVVKKNNKYQLCINGEFTRPMDHIKNWKVINENNFGIIGELNNKNFINVNDKMYGPYDEIARYSGVYLNDEGSFAGIVIKDSTWYYMLNGEIIGKATEKSTIKYFDKKGNMIAFDYSDGYKLLANGKEYPTSYYPNNFYIDKNLDWYVFYDLYQSKKVQTKNGIIDDAIMCISDDKKHFLISQPEGVFIDNKKIDDYQGFQINYNKEINTFIWMSAYDNTLFLNKYKCK